MRAVTLVLLLSGAALAAGCSDSTTLGPESRGTAITTGTPSTTTPADRLAVLTQNLYVGADLDAVIAALQTSDPTDDIAALLTAIATVQRTDFPDRAAAIADEIAKAQPHAIGLQEVSRIDISLPSPFDVEIHQNFLDILLGELAERGLNYAVAAQVQNIVAAPIPGVSLVDFDVLLVDPDRVAVHGTSSQNFSTNLPVVIPGVTFLRGWVSATVTINGRDLVLASTHLESGSQAGIDLIRAAQAGELVGSLDPDLPAVLMGDLNDGPGSPMYQVVTGAGFVDVWRELRPGVVGFTCCHSADLSNKLPVFDQRIDYIMARGLERSGPGLQGKIDRLGEVPADRLEGPASSIWPSDHAGLAAELRLPQVVATVAR